jgi:hypothetical protein
MSEINKQMTIEELLASMYKTPGENTVKGGLVNSAETWRRIANKDEFAELGFSSEQEKNDFLKQWCSENPYSNI